MLRQGLRKKGIQAPVQENWQWGWGGRSRIWGQGLELRADSVGTVTRGSTWEDQAGLMLKSDKMLPADDSF